MRVALVVAVLVLSGCQTPCPAPSVEARELRYRCEDGSELHVTFSAEQAVIEQEGYTTLTLPERISGSGFRYADNGAELSGRMGQSVWTRPGAAETACNVIN